VIGLIWGINQNNSKQKNESNNDSLNIMQTEDMDTQNEINQISDELRNDISYQNTTDIEELKESVGATRKHANIPIIRRI